jgi:hypothetical protein
VVIDRKFMKHHGVLPSLPKRSTETSADIARTLRLTWGGDRHKCQRYRGYCLEIICADFPAGASLDKGDPALLLQSISRFFKFLPGEQKIAFLSQANQRTA